MRDATMHRLFDPLGRRDWRLVGYVWLTVFFGRLALWYWIEDRWGRA
jgi:hypothetical protein